MREPDGTLRLLRRRETVEEIWRNEVSPVPDGDRLVEDGRPPAPRQPLAARPSEGWCHLLQMKGGIRTLRLLLVLETYAAHIRRR